MDCNQVFLAAFVISSLGGLAGFLRSKQDVDLRGVLAAVLYSGLIGLIIALLWYNHFEGLGNVHFLLGVAGLSGIGGVSAVDLITRIAKRGGLHITITPAEEEDGEDGKVDPTQGSGTWLP